MSKSYFWTDTPDGQDIIKKTNLAMKCGFIAGMGVAVLDQGLKPQPNLKGYFFRASAIVLPAMGAGAMFTLTSQMLCQNYPQIKPEFSYVLGAWASSAVVGAAVNSVRAGCVLGFYSGCIAYFVRNTMDAKLPGGILGRLPTVLNNDDDDIARDYRQAPAFGSLPPPAARPAKSASNFSSY